MSVAIVAIVVCRLTDDQYIALKNSLLSPSLQSPSSQPSTTTTTPTPTTTSSTTSSTSSTTDSQPRVVKAFEFLVYQPFEFDAMSEIMYTVDVTSQQQQQQQQQQARDTIQDRRSLFTSSVNTINHEGVNIDEGNTDEGNTADEAIEKFIQRELDRRVRMWHPSLDDTGMEDFTIQCQRIASAMLGENYNL